MEKINFSNGEKISAAKVTIDNVDYEVTPAVYDGATPLNATVFNNMQENIEDAIDTKANTSDVYTKQEVNNLIPTKAHQINVGEDTDYRVNLLKTKNLFDEQFHNGDIIGAATTLRITNTTQYYLKPGTYTFSTNLSNTYDYGVQVQKVGKPPLSNYPAYIYTSDWTQNASTTFTINEAGWLTIGIRKHDNSALNVSDISSFNYMLEEGSTATEYAPFIPNQINVDNEKYSDTINVGAEIDSRSRVNILYNKNLFDKNSVEAGYLSNAGNVISNSNFSTSNFIKLNGATKITIANSTGQNENICFYNSSKTFISYQSTGTNTKMTIDVPNNAEYVRATIGNANLNTYIVQEGSSIITPSIKVDNEEIYRKPKVLFEDLSGTKADILLNDSKTNYSILEIFYIDDQSFNNSIRIQADAIQFQLQFIKSGVTRGALYIGATRYYWDTNNPTKLLKRGTTTIYNVVNSTLTENTTADVLEITRILGYK